MCKIQLSITQYTVDLLLHPRLGVQYHIQIANSVCRDNNSVTDMRPEFELCYDFCIITRGMAVNSVLPSLLFSLFCLIQLQTSATHASSL